MNSAKQNTVIETDEVIKFEPKVIFALERLQPGCRLMTCSHNCGGVSSQALYEFIKEQYCDLDGDIESQVQTALQSCVKSGIVCALYNGKYRLIGPNPRAMVSNCESRLTHGPRCCCLTLIKCMSRSVGKSCCAFQWDFTPLKEKSHKQVQTIEVNCVKDSDKTEERKSGCNGKFTKRKREEDEKKNYNLGDGDKNGKELRRDASCQPDKKKSEEEKKTTNKDVSCYLDKDKDKEKSDKKSNSYNKRIENLKKRLQQQRNSYSPSKVAKPTSPREKRKICSSCGKLDVIYYSNKSSSVSRDD